MKSLTSVFGMGTGVPSSLLSPVHPHIQAGFSTRTILSCSGRLVNTFWLKSTHKSERGKQEYAKALSEVLFFRPARLIGPRCKCELSTGGMRTSILVAFGFPCLLRLLLTSLYRPKELSFFLSLHLCIGQDNCTDSTSLKFVFTSLASTT